MIHSKTLQDHQVRRQVFTGREALSASTDFIVSQLEIGDLESQWHQPAANIPVGDIVFEKKGNKGK
jgi:hypothetical protein